MKLIRQFARHIGLHIKFRSACLFAVKSYASPKLRLFAVVCYGVAVREHIVGVD